MLFSTTKSDHAAQAQPEPVRESLIARRERERIEAQVAESHARASFHKAKTALGNVQQRIADAESEAANTASLEAARKAEEKLAKIRREVDAAKLLVANRQRTLTESQERSAAASRAVDDARRWVQRLRAAVQGQERVVATRRQIVEERERDLEAVRMTCSEEERKLEEFRRQLTECEPDESDY